MWNFLLFGHPTQTQAVLPASLDEAVTDVKVPYLGRLVPFFAALLFFATGVG